MIGALRLPGRGSAASVAAVSATAVLGCGTAAALAGAAAGRLGLAAVGGGAAALALGLLMAEDRIDPLAALALSLPLPALYAAGDLRLPPALPVTVLVVAAWLLRWGPSGRPLATARLPLVGGAGLVSAYLIAGVATPHTAAAAREIANLVLLGALLLVATDLVARRPDRVRRRLPPVLAAVGGVTGALAVLEGAGVLPGAFDDGGLPRAALGFGQPNGLGMFLALSLPFAVHARRAATTRVGRVAALLGLAATVLGLGATYSRGSWFSVLGGTTILLLVGERRMVARIWVVALVAALGVDLVTGGAVRETLAGVLRDWSVAQRAALMLAGVRLFLENPVLGVGPGGFAEELERVGVLVPQLWDLKATPHNAYIQVASETGVVGLAAFAAFLVALVRRGLRLARSAPAGPGRALRVTALWVLGIALVEGLVEWPLSHGHGQLVVLAAALTCGLPAAGATGGCADPDHEAPAAVGGADAARAGPW